MAETCPKCGEASARHTPGPWEAEKIPLQAAWRVGSPDGTANSQTIIAAFYGPDAEANAKRCAANPDMYEALEKAEAELLHLYAAVCNGNHEAGENFAGNSVAVQAIRAALAKAKGGQ